MNALVVAVILGMAIATYATKAGGLWLLGMVDIGERTEAGLEVLPGAIIVAIVAPELIDGGPAEWAAAAIATAVILKTDSLLIALTAAMLTIIGLRSV